MKAKQRFSTFASFQFLENFYSFEKRDKALKIKVFLA
jgi:hypothetical protein